MHQRSNSPEQAHLHFRPMQETDLIAVYQLEKISQPYPWPRWFFRRQLRTDASCWVLEKGNTIIGFGIMRMVRHWAHIMNMCIAPEYRRQGYGRRMLLHLLLIARQQHANRAWLEVRTTNRPAIMLYRKLRFRVKHIRKAYYQTRSGRQNALIMARRL